MLEPGGFEDGPLLKRYLMLRCFLGQRTGQESDSCLNEAKWKKVTEIDPKSVQGRSVNTEHHMWEGWDVSILVEGMDAK